MKKYFELGKKLIVLYIGRKIKSSRIISKKVILIVGAINLRSLRVMHELRNLTSLVVKLSSTLEIFASYNDYKKIK